MSVRIMIAGGGTGGHIFPAVAVANAIKAIAPDSEILFVGANGKMEMEKVPQSGYPIRGIDMVGLNRTHFWKNISLPYKFIKSLFQVRAIFTDFLPDVVFGVGGYSTLPVLKFAQAKGIPTFIHEANAFAGKANRWLAPKCVKVFTGTPNMEKFFPAHKIEYVGNPVRSQIANLSVNPAEGRLGFGLSKDQLVLLVVGGSLGALSINKAILRGIPELKQQGLQLIWQTGQSFGNTAAQALAGYSGVWQGPFISKMSDAYAAADIVVSRAGAMSVAELCMVGKPVIFVPYPFAAEDHQTANAMALVENDAAILVKDSDVLNDLVPAILKLSSDKAKRDRMSTQIKQMAKYDADKLIASELLNAIKK